MGTCTTDLSGKRALVTGAGSGIGAATARRLAESGAHVVALDFSAELAGQIAAEVRGESLVMDLSDTASILGLQLDADIVVNNAGLQHVAPIEAFPADKFDTIMRVMLHAPFFLVRACLPAMYARGWGRIVNISSVHGLRASPYKSAYVAAKHGLEGLSKVTALEGGPRGVTSNCINPAYVATPLVQSQIAAQARQHSISESEVIEKVILSEPAIKRLIEPAEVAEAVIWLCSPESSFINGTSLVLDGGWTAR